MRLLLDEHYSPLIAEKLRDRGYDVVAVVERSDLAGRTDAELLSLMSLERRVIVTENWGDFQRELQNAAAVGSTHFGIVFTSRSQLPRGKNTVGLYVRVLDDFLNRHQPGDALRDSYRWLPDRPITTA